MNSLTPASKTVGHWDGPVGRARYEDAYRRAFAALPGPAETLDVPTSFGTVRCYRFAGTGAGAGAVSHPFLLLPGKSSGTPIWADNLPSLLALGDVYALDLLGEPGMSVQRHPIADEADQAAWLAELLNSLPADGFHLVGISFGGWTAVNLTIRDCSKVATLTLVDPALVFGNLPLGLILRSIPATVRWLPASWRDRFNSQLAGGASVEGLPVAEMIESGMKHFIPRLPQLKRIPEAGLSTVTVPTLAIIAGSSAIHDATQAAEVATRCLPNVTVEVYDGASHAVIGEEPERIATDIARLIESSTH